MEFGTLSILLGTAGLVAAGVGALSLWQWLYPSPTAEELLQNLARVAARIESLEERQSIVQLAIEKNSQFLTSMRKSLLELGEEVPIVIQYKAVLQDYLSDGEKPSELLIQELYRSLGKSTWESKGIIMLMRLGLYTPAHSRRLLLQVQAWLDFQDMNILARKELMEETQPRLDAAFEENDFLSSGLSEALEEQAQLQRALLRLSETLPVEGLQVPPEAPALASGLPWWALAGGAVLTFLGLSYFYHTAPSVGSALQVKKSLACWAVVAGITGATTALGLLPPFLLLPVGLVLRLGLLYGWRRFHGKKLGK